MNVCVTFNANRYYIKGFRVIFVMIMLCSLTTYTFQGIRSWQFTCFDGIVSILHRSMLFREFKAAFEFSAYFSEFIFFGLVATFYRDLTRFALPVTFQAIFTFLAALKSLPAFPDGNFAGSAFPVESYGCFALFTTMILFSLRSTTLLAISTMTIFRVRSCIIPRYWFNFLAGRASFCFNRIRHGFFLVKTVLEPQQTQYLCGSFYYITQGAQV